MIADGMNKVRDVTASHANQDRAKQASLDTPELSELLEIVENEEIDPDEPLDTVPRRKFCFSSHTLVLISSRCCHSVCCSESQSTGGVSGQLPSSPSH